MSNVSNLTRAVLILSFVFACTPAWADPAGIPAVQIVMSSEGGSVWTHNPAGEWTGEGELYTFAGEQHPAHGEWTLTWDLLVDPDPQINSVFGVTNNTGVTQTYTVSVMLPIFPSIPGSTVMDGSMQGGVTDNTNNGIDATVATDPLSGDPMYYGLIDGSPALPLHSHPFSVSASYPGSANIPAVSATGVPGPAALASIGIQHRFTLTPGDSATMSSLFVVTPEPASLVFLGLGSLLLLRRRR